MSPVRLADLTEAALATARFGVGPPFRAGAEVGLHRVLSGRDSGGAPLQALAAAARMGQVAVLAHETVPQLRPLLAEAAARQRRLDALLGLAEVRVASALGEAAPVALMKGSAAAAWVYPESAWRQRRDLDLLAGEALPEVRRVLLSNGFRDANDPRLSQDPRRVRAWNMSIALGGGLVSLDLHRDLADFGWCRPDIKGMLDNRVAGRAALPVTAPADTMINTVIHLLGTGFHEPLKGWIDLLRLLPLVTPKELASRARSHRVVIGTWLCLGVLGRWFEAPVELHREALGRPRRGALLEYLTTGEHATPERRPLPRGLSYRLWPWLVRDLG